MDASELLPALSSSISSMFALLALEFIFLGCACSLPWSNTP